MLLQTLNQQPLDFTQGDTVTLTLVATDDSGNPQNLTGASLSTQILGANNVGPVTFPNSQHTILNQTTNLGQFTLSLANGGNDTASCSIGAHKQIVTEATISGANTFYHGNNILTVYGSAPNQ